VTEKANVAIAEMTKRNVTLSRVLLAGEIGEKYIKPLQDAGVKIEEVKA